MMRFIPQNSKSMSPLLIGLNLLLCVMAGCKEEAPPAKPAVVSKRIEQSSQKASSEQKTAPAVQGKETIAKPAPAAAPNKKNFPRAEAVKKDMPSTNEAATGKETEKQKSDEPLSLRSSLPDTSPLYDPSGRIDPFMPLFSDDRGGASDSADTKPKRPLTPLEQIDLSQLKLVAILRAQNSDRAMVEDATGKGYILTLGTYIGINSGKVTKILKDSVFIEEETKDFLGKVTANTRELKLQKPFGEE